MHVRGFRLFLIALLALALPAAAQSDLSYGSIVRGQTDAQYSFTGSAGDLVTAEVVALTPGWTPLLTLSDGSPMAQSQIDPLSPGSARLIYRLPISGSFTLAVSGGSGEFVLTLDGQPGGAAQTLAEGTTQVEVGAQPQLYLFGGPAELHLTALQGDFSAEIRDHHGLVVASFEHLPRAAFAIDAPGSFELALQAGSVQVDYLLRADLLPAPVG